MLNPGKIVIVVIVAVAIAAAGFSTWYHYQHAHRSQDFWGIDTAVLIAQAPGVEVLQLAIPGMVEPTSSESDVAPPRSQIAVGAQRYDVLASREAAKARGMSNVRRALVIDTTFDWESATPAGQPRWQYAIDFRDGSRGAMVLFDFDTHQVASALGQPTTLLDPAANADMRQFFAEQFGAKK
jgi:hypothetical protein